MKLRARTTQQPEINVGSFADIAFLLIIFFILSTQLVKTAGEELRMPSGTQDQAEKTREQLTVSLRPGEIRYGEKARPLSFGELRTALAAEALPDRPENERVVILDADPAVTYEEYYQVAMAITRAGGVLAIIETEQEGALQ